MKTYIFKTYLFRDKKVVREIEVPENFNLYKLAEAIVKAYDFDLDHAFGFFSDVSEYPYRSKEKYELFADMDDIEPTGAKSVKKTKISEVWKNKGNKMLFLFDYGDCWYFVVELIEFDQKRARKKYPYLIRKVGKAPEQYPEVDEDFDDEIPIV
mgnify:FL=1